MPVADDQSTEPTECEEDRDAERSGHEESAVHRGVAELLTELLHDDADARLLSLTEELLTDDGARLRDLTQRYLTEQGFAVQCAADGRQMDRLLASRPFDLLILDLMLMMLSHYLLYKIMKILITSMILSRDPIQRSVSHGRRLS